MLWSILNGLFFAWILFSSAWTILDFIDWIRIIRR